MGDIHFPKWKLIKLFATVKLKDTFEFILTGG